MEDRAKESFLTTSAQERIKLIKEERRKQHEQRLERSPLYTIGLSSDDSGTLRRFSKYRRSDRERLRKDATGASPSLPTSGGDREPETVQTDKGEVPLVVDVSKEHIWNVSPLYLSPSIDSNTDNEPSPPEALKSHVAHKTSNVSEVRPHNNASILTSSLSLDQTKGVLKKPSIPPILRSATEPTPSVANDDEPVSFKKPSILKKKDDSSNTGIGNTGSSSGQSASVSFGLPESKSVLTRTKSIDSNLSGDTETGYWSGGENSVGILKNRRQNLDGDYSDQSSILKSRRSSLGSSILSSSGSEGGLQSILKRKLSYDSSYILKEANNSNEYSFSTHSLPACGCLSPEPKPILKKKCSSEDFEEIEPKPILKHRTSRDYHDISVDTDKIKPCLKKSSSKSVDENSPASSSVNYSSSFPASSSISYSNTSDGCSSVSGASKSILKKGGILKNTWRDPPSTSNSSSSSEIENIRAFQSVEKEDFPPFQCSSGKETPSDLIRARRSYCSESDINESRLTQLLPTTESELPNFSAVNPSAHLQTESKSDGFTAASFPVSSKDVDQSQSLNSDPVPGKNGTSRVISTSGNTSPTTVKDSLVQRETASSFTPQAESVGFRRKELQSVQKTNGTLKSVLGDEKKEDEQSSNWLSEFKLRRNSFGSATAATRNGNSGQGSRKESSNNFSLQHDVFKSDVKSVQKGIKSDNEKRLLRPCSLPGEGEDRESSISVSILNSYQSIKVKKKKNSDKENDIQRDNYDDTAPTLSVAERRSLFLQLENESNAEAPYYRKQKEIHQQQGEESNFERMKRHTTQPVTIDEVEKAAKMMVQNQQDEEESSHHHDNFSEDQDDPRNSHKSFVDSQGSADIGVNDQEQICDRNECVPTPYSDQCGNSSVPEQISAVQTKEETSQNPVTSKPPSGAARSRSRTGTTSKDSSFPSCFSTVSSSSPFLSRLNRITDHLNNINKGITRVAQKSELTKTGESTMYSMEINRISREDKRPVRSLSERTEVPESIKSLRERIRMFNNLASARTVYPNDRISGATPPGRKHGMSKRFSTQPVISTAPRRLFEECGNGAATKLHFRSNEGDSIENDESRCKKTVMVSTSTDEDNESTVRDKEAHTQDESECSQSLGSLSTQSYSGSKSVASPFCSLQTDDSNSEDEQVVDTEITLDAAHCSSGINSACNTGDTENAHEMPEKVLAGSDDGTSSNEEGTSDPYSCTRRKINKSSSTNSMMLSPESEVSVFQKNTKLNRNSIAEKIAALQTNGEGGWKKRMVKINPDYPDKDQEVQPTDQNDNVELRRNNKDSSVIANRLSQLESSQEKWKKRVGENDATIFTVQGKLEKAGKLSRSVPESPVSPTADSKIKGIKVLTPLRFRNTSETSEPSPKSTSLNDGSSRLKELNMTKLPAAPKLQRKYSRSETGSSSESSEEEKVTRSVTRNDNETFSSFFDPMIPTSGWKSKALSASSSAKSGRVQIDESSFKAIQKDGRQLLGARRNVKAPRNHTSVKNPVKALALRLQEQSYVELSPQVREKEMKKRIHVENLAKNAQLSVEALAGLASKEDFTSVKLKKAGNERNVKDYPHPMLIRIKGKRQVQTRLVPPEVESLSSGDNYILVTANKLYQFIGEYSNRIEKVKLGEIVSHIVQKKDLGCSASHTEVATLEEPLIGGRDQTKFFEILGGVTVPETDDLGDEVDEVYESGIVTTNRIFEVDDAKEVLVPLLESAGWKCQPRHSLLQDDRVLVFDFGTEMYVWSGSKADLALKKTAYQLAKELFDQGYCFKDVEPLSCPMGKSMEGSQRPSWCFLKKINQHMEPILFIEKFYDWPDDSGRLIRVQKQCSITEGTTKEANYNFKACDVESMLESMTNIPDPIMELEGFNVGRGNEVQNEDGRVYTINTLNVKAWNISEFSKSEVDEAYLGQFYSEETRVIKWEYRTSHVGRDLKGNLSRHHGALGRERCTYFFWQGKNSKITEQGTSALMTVELDSEKGPQVRVEQGREPPAFLYLFKGLMFIHMESKEAPLKDTKLYIAVGACEEEGHLVEVQCESSSLRSMGSFLLGDFVKGRLYLWHGKHSNSTAKAIAKHAANKILEAPHQYLNYHGSLRHIELEEGEETPQFLSCLNISSRQKFIESFLSLKTNQSGDCKDITVFGFTTLQGSFEAMPVLNMRRKSGHPEAFPLLQEELYLAPQPKLFLISRGSETWLWQGWTPRDEENENATTGSGEIRWAAERKCAVETAFNFCRQSGGNGYLVLAGLEPQAFTNIFPYWKVFDEARDANLVDGRTLGMMIPLEEAHSKFQTTRSYTLEELQERPEGVDQSKLETYLNDEDFESILKMDKEEFKKLQSWKQNELKKAVGLF